MATKGSEEIPTEKTMASCSGGVTASDSACCKDDFEMCVEQPQVDFNMEKLLSRVRRLDMEELYSVHLCYVTSYVHAFLPNERCSVYYRPMFPLYAVKRCLS